MPRFSRVSVLIVVAFLLVSIVVITTCACKAQVEISNISENLLCVASWNVQNLFDAVIDGTEYDEYKNASGWNENAYQRRLSNLSNVLSYLPQSKDYIVVLNEVENSRVVEALLSQKSIVSKKLSYFAFASNPSGAVGVSVASSIPIASAKVHYVNDSLRPVLEVGLDTDYGKVFVLACHLKSNIGGVEETSSLRLQTGQTLAQVSSFLKANNPGCLILICGDFNEECWDENTMGREEWGEMSKDMGIVDTLQVNALQSDVSQSDTSQVSPSQSGILQVQESIASLSSLQKTSSVQTASKAPLQVSGKFEMGKWYCFWLDDNCKLWPSGSYCYQGLWKCYDNILVSQTGNDGYGYEYLQANVIFTGAIRGSDDKPNAWNRNLLTGISDHLPVYVLFGVR